jgi:hypothetical protein
MTKPVIRIFWWFEFKLQDFWMGLFWKRGNFSFGKLIDIWVDPCESSCFSTYINCEGIFFPCSFLEGEGEWKEGLNVLTCESFNKDIWMHPKTIAWRNKLLSVNRRCPYYFQEVPK